MTPKTATLATPPQTVNTNTRFPIQTLTVVRRNDPVLETLGHRFDSEYADRFWLPILGPSATALLRIFDRELNADPQGFTIACHELACRLGIGTKGGKNSPLWRTVERACRFNATQRNAAKVTVIPKLPPLTIRQISRLPEPIQNAHTQWADQARNRGN